MKLKYLASVFSVMTTAVLVACGGGGGGSTASGGGGGVTISGFAATGNAMAAGSNVSAICTGGSGSTTTNADGSYKLSANGALPCYLRATDSNDSTLQFHSIATGSDTTTTANISPLTELVVAQVVGAAMSPSDAFDKGAAPTALIASSLDQAVSTTMTALNNAGISGVTGLTGVNPIKSTTFKPAINGQNGDALDQAIDSLNSALSNASSSIGQLANVMATTTTAVQATASIAAYTPSQPFTSACPSLRNLKHRMVTLEGQYHTITPIAGTNTLSGISDWNQAGTVSMTWVNSPQQHDNYCKFTFTSTSNYAGSGTGAVSKASGVISIKGVINGSPYLAIAFPDQNIPISALAGNWNTIGFDSTSNRSKYLTFSLDAAGNASSFQSCSGSFASTCTSLNGGGTVAVDTSSAGGYIFTDSDGLVHHAYAFRGASGNISLIVANANRTGITVAAQQRTLKPPKVVGSPIDYAEIETYLNNNLFTVGYWDNAVVVNEMTNASTYKRTRTIDNNQSDGRIDYVTINTPRPGMRIRPNNTCTLGVVGHVCPDTVQIPLPDMGMNVYGGNGSTTGGTADDFFGVSMTASQ
jgi:hypothetical protein